jgi:hypothetical protein
MESWSWKNCDGNKAFVEIYADADKVKLVLNNKVLGEKRIKNYKAIFKTKYAPGELMAIAFNSDGIETGRTVLASATGSTKIIALSEKDIIKTGEVLYLDISLAGENGVVESNADRKLSVTVEGGELLAFGSANPRTEEQYHSGKFTTYYGRAQVVVRGKTPGNLKVSISGEDLKPVIVDFKID